MTDDVTVVVLAAGLGTRMKSKHAKVLHEAGGDTLLNHVLRAAAAVAPPERIITVVGYQAAEVRASVTMAGVRFVEQHEQKGTGHAVRCAREAAATDSGWLVILNGDGPLLRTTTVEALVGLQMRRRAGGAVITTQVTDPTGYGRVVRDGAGDVAAIVEEKAATAEQRSVCEINTGVYVFDAALFWAHIDELSADNAANEYYLTDMVELLANTGHAVTPMPVADESEVLGVNTRAELAVADGILRARKTHELMLDGVTIENPASVLVDPDVTVGAETFVSAGVQLRGRTKVGANCRIGAGSILRDCEIGDEVELKPYVVAENTRIGKGASVGPFARLRQQAEVGEGAHVGNFVELKNTALGNGAKANHLSYLGDAAIGAGTNVGAGSITCNYDGKNKHRTVIGEVVFVGSNATLVAPLEIGAGAYIAAGSVITGNVDADALALGRVRQVDKPGWAKRRRESSQTAE